MMPRDLLCDPCCAKFYSEDEDGNWEIGGPLCDRCQKKLSDWIAENSTESLNAKQSSGAA